MKFKIENYKLKYTDSFPFSLHTSTDSSVTKIQKIENGIVFANNNKVKYMHKKKCKTITKFFTEISSICATNDLCIAGDFNGNIKAIDYKKNLLQTTDEHTSKINEIVKIDKTIYASCSNDFTTKIFDLSQKKALNTYKGHNDYVNCVEYTKNVLYTGGMDKLFNMHDIRNNSTTKICEYTNSINKIRNISEYEILVVTKSQLHLYDLRNNQNVRSCYVTSKNIIDTKINDAIFYCATQDSYIKTYNKNLQKISQYKFEERIESFDMYNDEICVGCTNGDIYNYNNKAIEKPKKKEDKYEVIERYYKDRNTPVKRVRTNDYQQCQIEKLINNNQHWLAFTQIINEESLQMIFAALSFIKEQNGLKKVLKDRKIHEIHTILDFITDNFHIIEFRSIFLDIITIVFAMYERMFQKDEYLAEKLDHLTEIFEFENAFEESAIILQSIHEAKMLE